MSRKYQETFRCYLIDHHSPPPPIVQFDQIDLAEYETFIQNLNCDSLMVYCKDHWGASYYDTRVPGAFRHEGLNFDFVKKIRSILDKKGIEFVAYYCIEYDAGAAANFPGWRVLDAEGLPVIRNDTYAKWPLCCYQTGYRDYCLDQLAEMIAGIGPDALFLDIFGSSLCYCNHCREKFSSQFGYYLPEPPFTNDKHLDDIQTFLHGNEKEFLEDIRARLKSIDPDLAITINFASHYPEEIRKLLDYQFCEPILQDNWYSSAYSRATSYGRFPLLMPGEFSQVYNYPSTEQYVVELSEIAAQGCRVGMYSGSQHVDGSLEMEESLRIGAAFREIENIWPQIKGSEPLAFAAIIQCETSLSWKSGDFPQDSILRLKKKSPHLQAVLGAMKLCDRQNIPWRLYTEDQFLAESDNKPGIVLLPDVLILSDKLVKCLTVYLEHGGTLVATVPGDLDSTDQSHLKTHPFWNQLGLIKAETVHEFRKNGWGGYLKATDKYSGEGLLKTTTPPINTRWYKLEIQNSAETLVEVIPPVTAVDDQRWVNWWSPPPSTKGKSWPGLIRSQMGLGKALVAGFELFSMASQDEFPYLHDLFYWMIGQALHQPEIRLRLDNDLVRTRFSWQKDHLIIHQISQLPKRMDGKPVPVNAGQLEIDEAWLESKLQSPRYCCQQTYPINRSLEIVQTDEGRIIIPLPDFSIQQIITIS